MTKEAEADVCRYVSPISINSRTRNADLSKKGGLYEG
jgi:hypothetical protein